MVCSRLHSSTIRVCRGIPKIRVVALAELGRPDHFASGEDVSVGRYVWPGGHRGKLTDCRRVLREQTWRVMDGTAFRSVSAWPRRKRPIAPPQRCCCNSDQGKPAKLHGEVLN